MTSSSQHWIVCGISHETQSHNFPDVCVSRIGPKHRTPFFSHRLHFGPSSDRSFWLSVSLPGLQYITVLSVLQLCPTQARERSLRRLVTCRPGDPAYTSVGGGGAAERIPQDRSTCMKGKRVSDERLATARRDPCRVKRGGTE